MKILVTGGAGFIGSRLVHLLTQAGDDPIVFDRRINPDHNILLSDTVREVMNGCQAIVHLAAQKSVPKSLENPCGFEATNAEGTIAVLQAARTVGVKKFIHISSSSVYGGGSNRHETDAVRPRSPYAVSKLAGESYARVWAELFDVPTVVLRLFNVYGPGQPADDPYSAVIPRFLRQTMHGEPLTIYGDGRQTRDFTYIDDACQGITNALDLDVAPGSVFNIATGYATSVNDIASAVLDLVGRVPSQPDIKRLPWRIGDVADSSANIRCAMEQLHYQPRWSLEEGLKMTLDAMKAQIAS